MVQSNENESYVENINSVYNALNDNNKVFSVVVGSKAEKLTEAGNVPYIDADGYLRINPIRYKNSINKYCEKNNFTRQNKVEKDNVMVEAEERKVEIPLSASDLVAGM